ncbi:aldehyde dehydrogenase family protein [Robertmurraya andreesenii]|uniref:Propionaldehyde dehydrogenase n=1 Tax=Anoxybacillus andreesenii TaxID=1325932 RepID=A0ABT9V7F2_9BACL|nr:aldehyde dehydrogenase family protein [Robertmurraya andreesenii]MDQ0156869.1 propionaldehyde dehydrogenase [Robertmurraya andreesenii]
MTVHMTEQDIQKIIQSVLQNINAQSAPESTEHVAASNSDHSHQTIQPIQMKMAVHQNQGIASSAMTPSSQNTGLAGVFEKMEDAIEAAYLAQREYLKRFQLKEREQIISAIRATVLEHKEQLAKMVYEETKLGRYEDKVAKHELVASKTPGTEDLTTNAFSGDDGLTIVEQAPFGLIGAVTPVTNPTETIINNSIGILASGNAVVLNVHPSSKHSCAFVVDLLNKAIQQAGGPENLITMVKNPTLDTLNVIIESPKVRLLVGTGGPGLVKTLLKSGKKAIGAGAGNPPVIVDETADLEKAAKSIIEGASFDNNLLCIAEKELFVIDSVADDLIFQMLNHGAYMLDGQQLEQLMSFALEENINQEARGCSLDNKREYHVSKEWVGKDATAFLQKLGIQANGDVKLLICEVDFDHPFVQLEQMMPVFPIVRVKDLEQAIDLAVLAEHGNRHTAIMHSRNVDHLTKFARAIETTIFVKNASSLAGVGFGGEGHTTMTIAGPTGEGITSAKTFTRQRRCVLAEGGFRIIG